MLKDELSKQIIESLKSGNSVRVSTLRLLANALHNEEIAKRSLLSNSKQDKLTEDDEVAIVKRQLKQREEAVEAYAKAGRAESAEKEKAEGEILKEFLPEQMSEEQVGELIDKVISESVNREFGSVMKEVMSRAKGKADGKLASELVRVKLSVS